MEQRPAKKRRTVKGRRCIQEGDDITADGIITRTVIRHTDEGPVKEVSSRYVWLKEDDTKTPIVAEDPPDAEPHPDPDAYLPDTGWNDVPDISNTARPARTQHYYLQQFVDRVHPMLTALMAREIPEEQICHHCPDRRIARWRCRDCSLPSILCRQCMRHTHMADPLHRIETWTGTHFRRAELWQVGVYMLIPHHKGERLCPTLRWNRDFLESFQGTRDREEQTELKSSDVLPTASSDPLRSDESEEGDWGQGADGGRFADDADGDNRFGDLLNELYDRREDAEGPVGNVEDILEEDEDEEVEVEPLQVPSNYMPSTPNQRTAIREDSLPTDAPRADALDNPYLRVVHTNGVHNISTVCCTCRGREHTHSDLMAARLIPTSFTRYRSMFTHAVLDDFRITNLECKASAYQYFQKLRRETAPMSPESVPNLYHELRRMSRLWRWMKKLKWSGVQHELGDHMSLKPGALANFCPACPQPGINLPEGWQSDKNRFDQCTDL